MNNDIDYPNKPRSNKAIAGIILLVVGAVLLLDQLNIFAFPYWLFRWPMILIVIGLYNGAKHNFRNANWFIMVILGTVFLLNDVLPGRNVGHVTWPLMIIAFGLWMILRRNHRWDKNKANWDKWADKGAGQPVKPDPEDPSATTTPPEPDYYKNTGHTYGDDTIDAVSVFGGIKKTILSKNFRGGEIVNIFGGAELDLTQADINGRVIIDITQIFGGTKIVVPSNWQVVSDMAAVFASVDDKRLRTTADPNNTKILVLKGVSIFAGIDIRSY